jgi:peptidoglycan-N-acetylglucosamine deacetylase
MRSLRASALFICIAAVGVLAVTAPVRAQDCPGNPDVLGTSRVLVLEPGEFSHVGLMQYPQTLPLADKEVVLTFDDGPLPRYSNQVLDILAAQCVKATYFLVGEMARAYPGMVRRIYESGHTIGTHSEDHPSHFGKLPIEKVRQEIDDGIADVAAALGDPQAVAPFFRIPGLARTDAIEEELAARSLVAFSSDTVADDWHRRIKPKDIIRLAMTRLQARGKGILLLHDIHAVTVAALPELLKQLKNAGFRVVHVVPAPANRLEIAAAEKSAAPAQGLAAGPDATLATAP